MLSINNYKIRLGILTLSGGLLVCGFAPYSYWWLTLICPAILYVFLKDVIPSDAFKFGFVFGLIFFGFGVPWTYNSIHEYGHAPAALSAFLAGLLILVLAIFSGLSAYLFSRIRCNTQYDFFGALAFSTIWTLFEWVRSWIFTGFPWLLLGHAHHSSPFKGIIPIFGTYGATFVTLLTSCFFIVIILGKFNQKVFSGISLAFIVLAHIVINEIIWTHADDEELSVALIQGNIPQEMKWDRSMHPYIMEKYRTMSEDHFDTDVVVWPETAIPTFYSSVKDTFIEELKNEIENRNAEFLIGVFTFDPKTRQIYNSLMILGEEIGFYRKRHLVPFGEYIPLRGITSFFDKYIQIPMSDLSSGTGRPLVKLSGYNVGTSICYEVVYGNEVIESMPEAKFLINLSNDAWFGDSAAPHQHLEIARSRAIETGRYLLRATNTGISAVIDPNGHIINKSAQFQEDVVSAKIKPYSGITPFSRWGNRGIVTVLFAIFFIIYLIKWQKSYKKSYSINN